VTVWMAAGVAVRRGITILTELGECLNGMGWEGESVKGLMMR
jgi:hypothetical protein